MSGLYRAEVFIPGCLNDGDEWFETEHDANAYADDWGSAGLPALWDRHYTLANDVTYDGIREYKTGWISEGVDHTGTNNPVSYRASMSHYPYYDWCPLCEETAYDTTEREECESCWNAQCDAADRETE